MLQTGIVYGIYGLAFFSLGISVTVRSFAFANSRVRNRFLALGLFGLLHGLFEWLVWLSLASPAPFPVYATQGLAALSFLALGYFALSGFFDRDALVWNILLAAAGVWLLVAGIYRDPMGIEIATRWGLAVPSSTLVGLVFLRRQGIETPRRRSQYAVLGAAAAFFLYAGLQIFLTPGTTAPASVLNTVNFEAVTGIPVLQSRTAAGVAMMIAALTLLGSFDATMREDARRQFRETLARLEVSENLLKSVFTLAPAGIALARARDGRVIEANASMLNMLGLNRSEFDTLDRLDRLGFKVSERLMTMSGERDRLGPIETDLRRSDGAIVSVRLEATGLEDDGELLNLIVAQDITAARTQSRQLERQRAEAEAANIAKSQFLANMSHEIRTPMNAIMGTISVLQRSELDTRQRGLVDIAQRGGETLLSLLNDILDLSRIEAGALTLQKQPVNMVDIARRTLDLHQAHAAEKGLPLNLYAPDTATPDVLGDEVRIRQILSNLVSNAIKFTEAGAVSLEIQSERLDNGFHAVNCTVRDTGLGMDETEISQIFDRFSQADSSSTRNFSGTGLGLSIVRGLVEAMNGSIDVRSSPGEGSEFTVTFHLERADLNTSSAERNPRHAPPLSAAPQRRLLVVDDDTLNIATFRSMLDALGWCPTFLTDGQTALECAARDRFDIIILDLHMPDFDGYQTLQGLQNLWTQEPGPCPVIACTADAFADTRTRCLEAGFQDVLTKPVSIDTLNAILLKYSADTASS